MRVAVDVYGPRGRACPGPVTPWAQPVHLDGLDRFKATHAPLDIPPALHERLTEYYRPWNERLEQLPGVGFTWNEQQTKRTGHGDR